jgi:hypothetical protein
MKFKAKIRLDGGWVQYNFSHVAFFSVGNDEVSKDLSKASRRN